MTAHKISAEKDERTTTAIVILATLRCFLCFGTFTPKGFIDCPLLSFPEYGILPEVDIPEGDKGGEGGRPVE